MPVFGDAQRFRAWRRWRFLPMNSIRSIELQIYEKLSYEALNRHFCQTRVMRSPFFLVEDCLSDFALSVWLERHTLLQVLV